MRTGCTLETRVPGEEPRDAPTGARGLAAVGLAIFLLLQSASVGLARGTAAGTRIVASARVSYVTGTGDSTTVASNETVLVVAQVAAVDLEPQRSTATDPGTTVLFSHTLTNLGNGPDSLAVSATSATGWSLTLYRDGDGDGTLDPGDAELTGPLPLAADESAHLLVAVQVPPGDAVEGRSDSVSVRAVSSHDGSVSDHVVDDVDVRDLLDVTLEKSVDRTTATSGELLTYTIRYRALGETSATGLVIVDPIPAGSSYVPGTLRLDGVSQTDDDDDDAGSFDSARGRIVVRVGAVSGGNSGTVRFQVRVEG